jgi:type I restriction-modification system DNA methylase subunit
LLTDRHKEIAGKIWEIANRLRGPYRPPQYRLVMLPMVVLRRLDCVLEPTKDAVLVEHTRLIAARTPENAIPRMGTSQSVVARLERARHMPTFDMVARYAAAIGQRIGIHLVPGDNGHHAAAQG